MESMEIVQDVCWDGKSEPDSPTSGQLSLVNSGDYWLLEDDFAKDMLLFDDTLIDIYDDIKPTIDELPMEEIICEFEINLKDDQWLSGKPDLQFTDGYGVLAPAATAAAATLPQTTTSSITHQSVPTMAELKVLNPYEIIMELDKICEYTELTELTPPQTPPDITKISSNDLNQLQFNCEQQQFKNMLSQPSPTPSPSSSSVSSNPTTILLPTSQPRQNTNSLTTNLVSSTSSDVARELEIVDEILRSRAKDLPDWDVGGDDNDSNSNYSVSTSSLSTSIDNDNDNDDDDDDETYDPKSCIGKIKGNLKSNKKRLRPYGRSTEEKKSRKKEQNKNAATRYRQKKKQEMEEILEEERLLAERNEDLMKAVTDVEKEVAYLKKLLKEFYKNRKVIK